MRLPAICGLKHRKSIVGKTREILFVVNAVDLRLKVFFFYKFKICEECCCFLNLQNSYD